MRRTLLLVGAAMTAVLALATVSAQPAFAVTPLPAPSQLQAVHVADRSADLWWNYDPNHREDVVQRRVGNAWQEYARSLGGRTGPDQPQPRHHLHIPGLLHRSRRAPTSATVAPSAPVTFTTLAGPDAVPPTKPPTPMFSSITTTMVNVYWAEATDNVQVTGYYLQQLIGGAWTTIRTVGPGERFQTVSGLSAGNRVPVRGDRVRCPGQPVAPGRSRYGDHARDHLGADLPGADDPVQPRLLDLGRRSSTPRRCR